MNSEKVYILEDRAILYINGSDSVKYLQNLISNDIEKVNESKSCFASLLSPQGKFLFDFIVVKHKDGFFLDCDGSSTKDLIEHLSKYKLRSKVEIKDLSSEYVVGIIDTQTHFREPGSTDVEDLESGSRAAVLGGVTSVFEMPNTNPPTSNLIEFDKKLQLAKDRMHSNYAFYFGATPDNIDQLSKLKDVEGCCGVKLFAGSSTGKLLVDKEADIEKVISNSDRIVSIHSEDEEILRMRVKFKKQGDVNSHPEWRNVECAMSSTRRVVKIAERYNKKIHVLHVTTKEEVDFLAMHKKNVTFEITPQHLTLYAPGRIE